MTASLTLVDPAWVSVPPSRDTLGPEVADVCRMAGFPPDPEQLLALDALFAFGPGGLSAAYEFAVVCSRQNMKTGLFKQAALGWLFVTDQRLIVWSAHEMKTTKEAFRDLEDLITGCPALKSRLAGGQSEGIHRGNGEESIELATGQRIMFKARTNGGGRGLTGDKVILDEAFALQPSHMGSLLPTLSARPDPQVVYGSSAGLADSGVLRDVRDRGRSGGDPSLAYFEWCDDLPGDCHAPGCDHARDVEGCRLDDEARWRRANPAMGRRIAVSTIRSERRALPPAEFARERLGWWDDPATGAPVIDLGRWAELTDPESAPASPVGVCFAVDVAPDRSSATIASAGLRGDGFGHVEVVDNRRGTGWVAGRVQELIERWSPCAVIVDAGSPAGALLPDLASRAVEAVCPSTREVGQACGAFFDAVVEGSFRHRPDPLLDAALLAARKRSVGDAWMWDRRDGTDISPLVAVTLALWGFSVHGQSAPNIW